MNKFSFIQRLKDVSITKKLYFTVGAMAVLIALELFTLYFSINTLSSVRALVGAEGLWSKAQKDGIFHLERYYRTHDKKDFEQFKDFMKVPEGDHIARIELLKENSDLSIVRAGFIQGRIHPDDIDGIIKLFKRFHKVYYIDKAIKIWTAGDSVIGRLMPLGLELHSEITSGKPSKEMIDLIMEDIDPINEQLTKLEDEFTFTLGEGSRWLENIILKLLFVVAISVEITGLLITISISRSISKGLNEINRATTKIAGGDLSQRAKIFSKDEIGTAAVAINQMAEQLIESNKELGQFAYIASHDLQEPLRSISNYVNIFKKQYEGKLGEDADKYLASISRSTSRMQLLIKDMLEYSRIGHDNSLIKIDCNQMVNEVIQDMSAVINETGAKITRDNLPVINGYSEIKMVFQNLLSNAIKFSKKNTQPEININVQEQRGEWIFSISDNGIGIEKIYFDRIFIIFQRLHSQKEYPGTGIGLAHCKKILEMHGGKIRVESETGKGSIFYLTLPKIETNEEKT